jgi:hypothetical protein
MKKRNQVRKSSSNSAASPQSKSQQGKAPARPSCLSMYEAGQLACEIPLVRKELSSATIAAVGAGITVDQFIADAIKEKLSRSRGEVPKPARAGRSDSSDVAIAVYHWASDNTIAEFDLPAVDWSRIQEAAAQRAQVPVGDTTLAGFIRRALLVAAHQELVPGNPMNDLEDAVSQSNALLSMALDRRALEEEDSGDDHNQGNGAGVLALYYSTSDRLRKAFSGAYSYVNYNPDNLSGVEQEAS